MRTLMNQFPADGMYLTATDHTILIQFYEMYICEIRRIYEQ